MAETALEVKASTLYLSQDALGKAASWSSPPILSTDSVLLGTLISSTHLQSDFPIDATLL